MVCDRAPTNDTCSDRIKPTKFAPRQKKAIKNRSLKARVHANEPMFRWFPHGLRKHGSSAYYNRFHLNGRCWTSCLYIISPVILQTCKLEWFDETKKRRRKKKIKKRRRKKKKKGKKLVPKATNSHFRRTSSTTRPDERVPFPFFLFARKFRVRFDIFCERNCVAQRDGLYNLARTIEAVHTVLQLN